MKDILKIILISSLVSLNVVIWYEIFGFKFAAFVIVAALLILFLD